MVCYLEMHVLPTACALVGIFTALRTECLVVLHGIATPIFIERVSAWVSLVTEAS